MKRLLILAAAILLSSASFAQKMWVGGGFSAYVGDKSTFSIAPEFGYFFDEKLSVEGSLGLGFASNITAVQLHTTGRYWFDMSSDIKYNPGISLRLNHGSYKLAGDRYSTTDFDVVLELGVFDYIIAPNWSVRFNFCELSLNSLFDNPTTQFSLKTESTVVLKYYF
ncbi:MAG: outer membrane beta-barrel protein [Tidjanibacter sp.]|nr:outer membrane beta-barrel protein [Tidjanibacter sp.]